MKLPWQDRQESRTESEFETVLVRDWARVVVPKTGAGWWHLMSGPRIPQCGAALDFDDELDRTSALDGISPYDDGEVCPRSRTESEWTYES